LQKDAPVKSGKTGLGFHIIRDMAHTIGSTIHITSTPGGGTSVSIHL